MKILIETMVTLEDNKGHTVAASSIIRSEKEYQDKHSAKRVADLHNEKVKLDAINLIRSV
jgi:hypothetical protein